MDPVLVEMKNNVQSSVTAGAMCDTDANYWTTQDKICFVISWAFIKYNG